MVVALITASGSGTRMHQEIPKQFMPIMNKPLIIYTLEVFQNHPNIDAIIISCLKGWEMIMEAYAKQYGISKLKWIVEGGATGQESIYNALVELDKNCDKDTIVLVHDGNRPLVTEEIISDSIVTCQTKGSAVAVIPCNEVIVKTIDGLTSNDFLERKELRRTQTPHAYKLEKLLWAHDQAHKKGYVDCVATCDLMMRLGEKINFSIGSESNIKITTPPDIDLFRALISNKRDDK